jgi:hypothetical protein
MLCGPLWGYWSARRPGATASSQQRGTRTCRTAWHAHLAVHRHAEDPRRTRVALAPFGSAMNGHGRAFSVRCAHDMASARLRSGSQADTIVAERYGFLVSRSAERSWVTVRCRSGSTIWQRVRIRHRAASRVPDGFAAAPGPSDRGRSTRERHEVAVLVDLTSKNPGLAWSLRRRCPRLVSSRRTRPS